MKKLSVAVCWIVIISCEKAEETENETPPSIVTDYDGNTYRTKIIGGQRWMVNNQKATHYANGTEIAMAENTSNWEAFTS